MYSVCFVAFVVFVGGVFFIFKVTSEHSQS